MAWLTAAGYGQCGAAKLTSWEPQSFASFGTSVAIDGGVAIVGSPGDDAPGAADCGAVYFFTQSGLLWQGGQKFQAFDRAASDSYGSSVAIDGDWAAVGSPNDDYVGFNDLGSVYIYQQVNGVWVFQANVVAPVATRANFNRFSTTLALSGNTLVVGAEHEGGNRGAAYVFVRSGTVWNLQQRLQPPLLLLGRTEQVQQLHVPGVRRAAVHRLGGDVRAAPGDLGQRGVLQVRQARAAP
jgi:hypothetical protein